MVLSQVESMHTQIKRFHWSLMLQLRIGINPNKRMWVQCGSCACPLFVSINHIVTIGSEFLSHCLISWSSSMVKTIKPLSLLFIVCLSLWLALLANHLSKQHRIVFQVSQLIHQLGRAKKAIIFIRCHVYEETHSHAHLESHSTQWSLSCLFNFLGTMYYLSNCMRVLETSCSHSTASIHVSHHRIINWAKWFPVCKNWRW